MSEAVTAEATGHLYRPADPLEPVAQSKLRIGDKVRCTVADILVPVGTVGFTVNVAPPRRGSPERARIYWENETVSMMDATDFEMITPRPGPR